MWKLKRMRATGVTHCVDEVVLTELILIYFIFILFTRDHKQNVNLHGRFCLTDCK